MDEEPGNFERHVIIVGVGLIGGSIAAAIRKRSPAIRVTGVGRSLPRLQTARSAGLLTHVATDVSPEMLQGNPLVVVCLPVDMIADYVIRLSEIASPGALITDAGSVKESVCRTIRNSACASGMFVGSHPIAGGEQAGFEHADADLFDGRACVLIEDDDSPPPRKPLLKRAENFWKSLGCVTRRMGAAEHDRKLALTSHLPHIMAAVAASVVSEENLPLTGSGFRDTTRIAAGGASLWKAILMGNSSQVLAAIDEASTVLRRYRSALETGDAGELESLLRIASERRASLPGD